MKSLTVQQVRQFVEPGSVALVGVSSRTGPGSYNILEQMLGSGFTGKIYPVNPRGGEILGVKVYSSVLDLPELVDLAVISTPRAAVPGIVADCATAGIRAVIIVTQGFADADAEGKAMQRKIEEIARQSGIRLVGPNTLGVVNNYHQFSTSFAVFTNQPADVGVMCQSGVFLAGSKDFTSGLGICVDTGNTADISFADVLEYFNTDDRIRVVAMHLEGLRDGREFMATAAKVSQKKPLLVLKTGTSEAGARAAGSHSGSLAGSDDVYTAAFRQAGVIRVEDVPELNDLTRTFLTYKGMPGRRLAVITISGGAGITAIDACNRYGLEMAKLSPNTLASLDEVFPDWMDAANPVDIWPAGMAKGYAPMFGLALETALKDPGVDGVLCITPAYLPPNHDPMDIAAVISQGAAACPQKPVAAWIFGPHRQEAAARLEGMGNVVVYPSPERAARALSRLHLYYSSIKGRIELAEVSPVMASSQKEIAALLAAAPSSGVLNREALDLLRACGIPTAPYARAESKESALAAAKQLGYPVVLKIDSPLITHKTDLGGVVLDIRDEVALTIAYDSIMAAVTARCPQAAGAGVLVQKQIQGGIEVIVGAKRDPQFGPVIVFGAGGIFTELLHDVSFRVAPLTHDDAAAMITETLSHQLLAGFRGARPADQEALKGCLLKLSKLVTSYSKIAELDINPLLVSPQGAVALDARMVLAEPW